LRHPGWVLEVAFSADGRRVVSRDGSGVRLLWDAGTGSCLARDARREMPPASARSPDGTRFAHVDQEVIRLVGTPDAGELAYRAWVTRPAPEWHRSEAERLERGGRWPAVAFHVNRLLALDPGDPDGLIRRARLRLQWGRRAEALADLRRPELLRGSDPDGAAWYARGCLAAGDRAGYRRARAALLSRLGEEQGRAGLAGLVARTCGLAPGAADQLGLAVLLAEREAKKSPGSREARSTFGTLLLRVGRPRESVEQLRRAAELEQPEGAVSARNDLLLALAYAGLGERGEARRCLDRATAWLDQPRAARLGAWVGLLACSGPLPGLLAAPNPQAEPADPRAAQVGWGEWLELEVLRREAEARLGKRL
jgi:tetratricopeptide (TPR) repeat protein